MSGQAGGNRAESVGKNASISPHLLPRGELLTLTYHFLFSSMFWFFVGVILEKESCGFSSIFFLLHFFIWQQETFLICRKQRWEGSSPGVPGRGAVAVNPPDPAAHLRYWLGLNRGEQGLRAANAV